MQNHDSSSVGITKKGFDGSEARARWKKVKEHLEGMRKKDRRDHGIQTKISKRSEEVKTPGSLLSIPLSKRSYIESTSIVELRHDLLLRKEACFGRPLKSYEMGPQDVVFPEREYKIEKQGTYTEDYCKHPLYDILEKEVETMPFHSNWSSRIEWAFDRLFDHDSQNSMPLTGDEDKCSELLRRELGLVREFRCFSDAARDACVFLIQGLFEQSSSKSSQDDLLRRLGFVQITKQHFSDIWNIYCPYFDRDRVFIFDGMILTIINGGLPYVTHSDLLNETNIEISINPNSDQIKLREAEISYGASLKASQAITEALFEVRSQFSNFALKSPQSVTTRPSSTLFAQNEQTIKMEIPLNRIAIPVVAIVHYATFRIFVEPYILCSPSNPMDLALNSSFLNDLGLSEQLDFLRRRFGLQTNPFIVQSPSTSLASRPQILQRWKVPKIFLRRLACILPPMKTTDDQAFNYPWVKRFRPEFLTNASFNHEVHDSWFGSLNSGRFENECGSTIIGKCKPMSSGAGIVDTDLSHEERLMRQYDRIGTVRPFSTNPKEIKSHFGDYTCTRNTICDNHTSLILQRILPNHPNQKAIAYLEEMVIPCFISQLRECIIICHDVIDLSQALHSLGIPIHYAKILSEDPCIPTSFRLLISLDTLARKASHWFVDVVRPGLLRDLFNDPEFQTDKSIPLNSGTVTLESDVLQFFNFLLRDLNSRSFGSELRRFWKKLEEEGIVVMQGITSELLIQALQMHLGILAERRPSSDEKVLHYHRDRGHSEDTFGIEGLVDFLKPARTEWDKKRGSDVSVEGDLDVVSDLLSQETVDKYQRGMTPVLKRASGGPMSGQMVQLDSPGLKVSDFQILTSSCVVLFPHLSALQGKLVEHCLTRLPTLPHQVAVSIGRKFRGFIPRVRIVSPIGSLLSIESSRDQLACHLHRNLKIPESIHLVSQQRTRGQSLTTGFSSIGTIPPHFPRLKKRNHSSGLHSTVVLPRFESTGFLRPSDSLGNKLDLVQFANPTIWGNVSSLKSALLGGGAPCHPTCRLLQKEEVEQLIKESQSISPGVYYWPQLLHAFDKSSIDDVPRQCRRLFELVNSSRLLCLGRQALNGIGVYGSPMVIGGIDSVERLRADILNIGYMYLQHNFIGNAKAIGQYLLQTIVTLESDHHSHVASRQRLVSVSPSMELRYREFLLQIALREDHSHEAEEILNRIYCLAQISSESMMIPHVWNITILLGHLSLAAYYFYNEQNSQCLIHISRATKFCEFEFGNEYSNWISLVALSLMARAALNIGEFLTATNTCRQGIRGTRLSPYTTIVEPKFLVILASVHEKCGRYNEGWKTAIPALSKLDEFIGGLHSTSLSCLLLIARLKSQYGIAQLINPELKRDLKQTDEVYNRNITRLKRFDGFHWNVPEIEAPLIGIEALKASYRKMEMKNQLKKKTENLGMEERRLTSENLETLKLIWGDPERLQAREDAYHFYDQLFHRLIARRKLVELRHVILVDERLDGIEDGILVD